MSRHWVRSVAEIRRRASVAERQRPSLRRSDGLRLPAAHGLTKMTSAGAAPVSGADTNVVALGWADEARASFRLAWPLIVAQLAQNLPAPSPELS